MSENPVNRLEEASAWREANPGTDFPPASEEEIEAVLEEFQAHDTDQHLLEG